MGTGTGMDMDTVTDMAMGKTKEGAGKLLLHILFLQNFLRNRFG